VRVLFLFNLFVGVIKPSTMLKQRRHCDEKRRCRVVYSYWFTIK